MAQPQNTRWMRRDQVPPVVFDDYFSPVAGNPHLSTTTGKAAAAPGNMTILGLCMRL